MDGAKMGVIAHEPTLLKVSCDKIIFGKCIESTYFRNEVENVSKINGTEYSWKRKLQTKATNES